MTWWAKELLRSLRFLAANGQEGFWRSKRVYEIVVPGAIALVGAIVSIQYPLLLAADIVSKLANGLFQFMVFVVPFHLAALAAVATFTREELDKGLTGTDVTLRVWDNETSEYFYKSLTLRQYTCLLFGYLCTIGLAFILVYIVASGLNLSWLFGKQIENVQKLTLFLLVFYLAHYGIMTIYAVTFLFDKVSRIEDK